MHTRGGDERPSGGRRGAAHVDPRSPAQRRVARGWAAVVLGLALAVPGVSASAQGTAREAQVARLVARGDALLGRGRLRAAERAFTQGLRRDPTSAAALSGLARALLPPLSELRAQPSAATEDAARRVLEGLAGTQEAERRALLQVPEATALAALGRHREALALLSRPPRLPTPELAPALSALALLAAERGDLEGAEDALRLALELDPSVERTLLLADLLLSRGQAQRAALLLRGALELARDALALHVALARAQLAAGDAPAADETLRRVLARCPLRCGVMRAQGALEAGDATRAGSLALEVLGLPSGTTDEPLEEAVTARPGPRPDPRADAAYVLGLALARAGRHGAARDALEDALRRHPEHRGARRALDALPGPRAER